MALEARLRELDSRHRKLDRTIEQELTHPASDDIRIAELKRQKLRLKEEIEGLKARTH
ncbi:DUF465 domain-containing protein [Caulobacter sp. NIBR1757]|uniref:YdcH family protein n=1 Tax=Caulobacter sp. NIBR1757 TaxID=3016000 RepID=UPI0022F00732|nr:DUF465 domain-containing protein [Caulobacter sp. NIBR1757]WGM38024.1 hypothetical protein AMEJIAPC_00925 [Caulobacter sp. NIBR1757]